MAVLGLPDIVFFLWQSALAFFIGMILLWKPFMEARTKLMSAFFIYLTGMALMHLFLGLTFYAASGNKLWLILAYLSAVSGSAFTTRFPFSSKFPKHEKALVSAILLLGWALVGYLAFQPMDILSTTGLNLVMAYMILFAGLISSVYIMYSSYRQPEKSLRVKGVGGGVGMFLCCGVADLLVIFGGLAVTVDLIVYKLPVPELLMALSPVVIISSILYGRFLEKTKAVQQPQ